VHVTLLAADGTELPTSDAQVSARLGSGPASELTIRRLGPGHFVADATLRPGTWTFSFRATAEDGAAISGSFSEKIVR
jgi:nitrogen fixation protein FixH